MNEARDLDHDTGRRCSRLVEGLGPDLSDLLDLAGIGIEDGECEDVAEVAAETIEDTLDMIEAKAHLSNDIAPADNLAVLIEGDLTGDIDQPAATWRNALRYRASRLPNVVRIVSDHADSPIRWRLDSEANGRPGSKPEFLIRERR